jgi:hypothetical protein
MHYRGLLNYRGFIMHLCTPSSKTAMDREALSLVDLHMVFALIAVTDHSLDCARLSTSRTLVRNYGGCISVRILIGQTKIAYTLSDP